MTRDRLPKREQRRLAALRAKLEQAEQAKRLKAAPQPDLPSLLASQEAHYQRSLNRNEARDWKAVYDSERNRRFRHRAKTVFPPAATPRLRNVLK